MTRGMVRWVVTIRFIATPTSPELEKSVAARIGKDGVIDHELGATLICPILDVANLLSPSWRNAVGFHHLDENYHANNGVDVTVGGSARS